MNIKDILNFAGLIINIIGSIILAISLSRYLTSIHGAIAIHDMQLKALIKTDNKILIGDIGNLLKKGVTNSKIRTILGLVLLIVGFIIQAISILIK